MNGERQTPVRLSFADNLEPDAMKAPSFFRERKYRSVLVIGLDNAGKLFEVRMFLGTTGVYH